MKCGIGVCGSCCIDDTGSPVCSEGPVYCGTELSNGEFGVYHRDAAGRKEYF
jgi:dihydroorotate dehydrogenase electron transfer subunit